MLSSYFLTCASISFFSSSNGFKYTGIRIENASMFPIHNKIASFKLGSMESHTRKKKYRNFFKKTDKLIRKKINITNKTEFSHGLLHYVSVCVCFVESLKCHPLFKNMK